MKISRSILLLLTACYAAAAANTTVLVDSMDDFSYDMGTYGTTEFKLSDSLSYTGELTLPAPKWDGTSWVISSADPSAPADLYLSGGSAASHVVNTSDGSNNVDRASYTIKNLNNISISGYTGADVEEGSKLNAYGAFYTNGTGQQFHLVDNTGSLTFSNNTNIRIHESDDEEPEYLFLYSAVIAQGGFNHMGLYLDRNAGGITFSDNTVAYISQDSYDGVKYTSTCGSSIYTRSGSTSICDNGGGVSFVRNKVINDTGTASGGAISVGGETLTINNNGGGIELHENSVLTTWSTTEPAVSHSNQGGAISALNVTVEFCGNGLRGESGDSIRITNNEVRVVGNSEGARGGAIVAGKFRISGNEGGVQILNNRVVSEFESEYDGSMIHSTVLEGGAVYGSAAADDYNTFDISFNGGAVNIVGNYASAVGVTDNSGEKPQVQVRGGFYSGYMEPVRIFSNQGDVNITGNYVATGLVDTGVVDHYNSVALGGAIYSLGLTIVGNQGDVVFRGNYEQTKDFTRLRSVVINSTLLDSFARKFQISAVEGHSVTFYDSVYVASSGADISFNGGDPDMGCGLGDVIFTGATTVEDLAKIKDCEVSEVSEDEILASRTSVFEAMANVYRGRLVVQDGAVLQGKGITAVEGSGATVRVNNAVLEHAGCDLTFNKGTTLELEGVNSISGKIIMKSGSTLNFIYGQGLIEHAALTLNGIITFNENYVQLSGFENYKGVYKLMDLTDATLREWNVDAIMFRDEYGNNISGNHFVCRDNELLYYHQLDYVEWPSGSTDGSWNSDSLPSDDSDVYFGSNDTLETLTLEGDLNVYALTVQQGGKYEYAESQSGASLSVEDSFVVEAGASVDVQLSQGVEVNGSLESSGDFKATKVTGSGNVSVTGGSLELADKTDSLDVEGDVTVTNTELRGTWAATDLSIGDSTVVAGADITLGDATITSPLTTKGTLALQGKLDVQTGGLVLAGGNLVMNTSLEKSQTGVIVVKDDSKLTLKEGAEVSRGNIAGLSSDNVLTVEGKGKLNLGASADTTGYLLSQDNWTGTVKLENVDGTNNLHLDYLGQSGSTIELENCAGYAALEKKEITANLVLNKSTDQDGKELAALTINNGYSKGSDKLDSTGYYVMNTFSGTISGEGKMYFSYVPIDAYSGFEFTGNVKNWTGAFDMAAASGSGSYLTLKFSGNAKDINIDIIKSTTKPKAVLDLLLAAGNAMSLSGDIKTDTIQISKTGKVEFSGNVNTGSLTVSDAAELIFSGKSTTVSRIDSISGSIGAIEINGVTVELGNSQDDTDRVLKNNITVNSGATLNFTGGGSDILDYRATDKSITVDGGIINFGNGRQSLGTWGITLKNGATLKGEGISYESYHKDNSGNTHTSQYAAAIDIHNNTVITVESGHNSIESNIRLRKQSVYNPDAKLTFNVTDEKASVDVSGHIHFDDEGQTAGTIVKEGKGSLSLSSPVLLDWISHKEGTISLADGSVVNTFHVEENGGILQLSGDVQITKLQTKAGILNLSSADNVEKKVTTLDASMSGNVSTGTIRLEKNTKLEVTGQIWESKDASIELAENSELKNKGFVFTNKTDGTAVLRAVDNGKAYSHEFTEYSLENGYVKVLDTAATYENTGAVRMRNQLVNSVVENAGDCMLKVWNPLNSLSGVHATSASIQLFEQESHHLKELSVGKNLEISAFKDVSGSMDKLATLHVDGTAGFGSGITLNANLVMEQGTVVTMADTVKLEGTLTLQFGLTLKGDVLQEIASLEEGESYTLFTHVDALNLQTPTLYNMRTLAEETEALVNYSPLMNDTEVAAGDYFRSLAGNSNLVLSYNSNDGTVSIINSTQAIPEPATAALSLLGLAALAARRRRK